MKLLTLGLVALAPVVASGCYEMHGRALGGAADDVAAGSPARRSDAGRVPPRADAGGGGLDAGVPPTACVPDLVLCETTGGRWLDVPPHSICGHHVCGRPRPTLCESPFAGCDCGPGRSFVEGLGCDEDPSCTRRDLCLATGGRIALCDYACGEPPDACAGNGCNCGPEMTFDPEEGCVEAACGFADTGRALCQHSGGTWRIGPCCPTHCGQHCPDACVSEACECGRFEVFDPLRGCVESPVCFTREAGETCGDDEGCTAGLACCDGTCSAPCCGPGCDFRGCPIHG